MRNTTSLQTTQYSAGTLPPEASVNMPRLWDQKVLAAYLGKSTAWCERARWAGDGPRFVKLGRHVRYKAEDVLAWIDENARTCSGMEGAA
jgi:predicted DNA-binding transcriptional regulator AlpA